MNIKIAKQMFKNEWKERKVRRERDIKIDRQADIAILSDIVCNML